MSNLKILEFINTIKTTLADQIETADIKDNAYVSIVVKNESLVDTAKKLKTDFGFIIPIACGGVDYLDENRMQLIYYLSNPDAQFLLTLRVYLSREDPRTPSLTNIWEAMSFHEREAHEMLGIMFEGHPNLVPLLLPPNWKGGYPLRKDFKREGTQ